MSYDKTKTDPVLGQKVHEYLVSVGVETPVIDNGLSRKEKIEKIEDSFDQIVSTLGLDLKDDSLIDTPKRVAKMYVNEIFWGLDYAAFPKVTVVDNKMKYNEMVVEKGISVQSYCEHHLVNIDGLATVAYVPNNKVLGLSKMNRVVEYFSRRPQIQERLTEQIYHALSFILETENVALTIDAKHFCVKSRGVEDTECSTITSRLGGNFKAHPEVRAEFLALLKM
ncbi:MAG: GTP cyclohydrolase I FolE [Gammaproteobacteria bacterium]|nr:GTP cyclohydrolase I FolE [Gammaproteobacteria bacterium]|tara:strand:+ start:268 stop:939 length:672 start_codon:yes stop_codon:yes gene_type:complete